MTPRQKPIARSPVRKRRKGGPRRVSVVRDQKYRNFLRWKKCVACISVATSRGRDEASAREYANMPSDAAHTLNNGRSSKGPDDSCIPLCRHHHDEMDGRLTTKITTKAAFARKYGLDLAAIAAEHYARFKGETKS